MTVLGAIAVSIVPFLILTALLGLARLRERTRNERTARQVAVTDAIHRELGAVVAPVVDKPVLGPWRLTIAVPYERPALVSSVLAIARDTLMTPSSRFEIVLVRQPVSRATR
jgi:hypothetical protein